MNIKLEPEDVDSPSDQQINGVFVGGQLAETEEADSSHSYLCDKGVSEQELVYASNEADNGLNLVISGTTSVDLTVHEAFGVENNDPCTQITRSDDALSIKPKVIILLLSVHFLPCYLCEKALFIFLDFRKFVQILR